MGETFTGIMGNFNGYALENSNFDPQSDDSDVDAFFDQNDSDDGIVNQKAIRKSRKTFKKIAKKGGAFGGF